MITIKKAAGIRVTIGLVLTMALMLGLFGLNRGTQQVLAHEQTVLSPASGAGRCPAGVLNCKETWTHVNWWTHYTSQVPPGCTIAIIDQCGVTVTAKAATSSCHNSGNCGHGPHSSTPKPTGPGSWTVWKGHKNTNYRWTGQRETDVEHEHPGLPLATPTATASPTPTTTPTQQLPDVPNNPPQTPVFDPSDINWNGFNPCANGGCLPTCLTDSIPNNCPWEDPEDKVCTTAWSSTTRQRLRDALRWESIVPYQQGFTQFHHPEVPGGQQFLTAASAPANPARHWIALRQGSTLDVRDATSGGCLWRATEVGVSLSELLPYQPSDLAKLRSPGNVAAASEAQQAAVLWDGLDQERRQWYVVAFPRSDPATVWCPPRHLPSWTTPPDGVLSISESWETRYGRCRWSIPRRGFWEWQLLVKYTSEQGDLHTEVIAADLSWFRESTGYLGQQVTLW